MSTRLLPFAASLLLVSSLSRAQVPQRFADGVVNTGHDDAHVTFSPDGRELFFIRSTPDFENWTVLTSRFVSGRWSRPAVAPFSGRWSDADVALSPDGRRLFFISTRPTKGDAPRPDTELWVMERGPQGWGPPRHLAELESPGFEWFPTVTNSGALYFGSERAGGKGKSDLYRAEWLGDHFGPPENLGDAINTADQEIEPWVSPDESLLIFAAKGRRGGAGAYDLFASHRCGGRWSEPVPLGAGVNSAGWDFGARPSPDGKYLYFTSNRSTYSKSPARARTTEELTKALDAPGNGLRDVYRVEFKTLGLRSPCEP